MACTEGPVKNSRCEEEVEDVQLAKRRRETTQDPSIGGVPRVAGRVWHVGLADGELANRVVIVGHLHRAEILSEFLEPEESGGKVFRFASDRGYVTFTGKLQGQRISVVFTGMGLTLTDFFVREGRAVVKGPMAVVRFGTCGVLQEGVEVGTISVASEGSVLVHRDYAAFEKEEFPSRPYFISRPEPSDPELSELVSKTLSEDLGSGAVVRCMNASADSFYCSEGRQDPAFYDANDGLIEALLERQPKVTSMEMESYLLFHLARCCRPQGSLRASAACINVANRQTGHVLKADVIKRMEREAGKAVMRALADLRL